MNPSVLRIAPALLGSLILAAPASARVECESARAGILSRQARQHAVIQRCQALRKTAEPGAPTTPVAGRQPAPSTGVPAQPAASTAQAAAPAPSSRPPVVAPAVPPAR